MLCLWHLQLQLRATLTGVCFACKQELKSLPPFKQTSTA